jgi:membrane protein
VIQKATAAIEFAESRFVRLRRRHPRLDHLVRATTRYNEHYGDQHAAAITYFSVLSLVPLFMIAFSVAGFVLAAHPEMIVKITDAIHAAVPGEIGGTVTGIVTQSIDLRGRVGVVGLVGALYSGLGWMTNLRDALTAQWALERPESPFLYRIGRDLLALLGLGLALAVSFAVTATGSTVGVVVLRFMGLAQVGWVHALFGVLLSFLASWLVFLWVLARLPRRPVSTRSAMRGAAVAAAGLEVLKQVGNYYLRTLVHSPRWAAFGSLLGLLLLLLFIYLLSRLLLFTTAWIATARENQHSEAVPAPPPAVIEPRVTVHAGPSLGVAAGLIGIGALAGLLLRRAFSR